MQTQDTENKTDQPLNYEDAYHRLEELVEKLSDGGLSLEDSLRCFEQGMALANYCSGMLDNAELRVQQVNNLPPEELAALLEHPTAEATQEARPAPMAPTTPRREGPTSAASARREELPAVSYGRPEEPQAGRSGPGGAQSSSRQTPPANGRRQAPNAPAPRRTPAEELDPLFDEI